MAILVKTYIESIQGEIVPFESITSEKQLNIDRTLWEDGYNPEEEDFYCPVFRGVIELEINGKSFWSRQTSVCHEISMLWMHFRYASYDTYQSSLEGKSIKREVGGAGHGCETIFISASELNPKILVIEKDRKYGDIKEEIEGYQFIMSILTEETAFLDKLNALFQKPDSLIKEGLLKLRSMIQGLQK